MTDNVNIVNEVEKHEKLQRRILLIKSVALLLSVVIALLGATVAWFANMKEVSADDFSIKTNAPEAKGFSISGENYSTQSITLPCFIRLTDLDYATVTGQNLLFVAHYRVVKDFGNTNFAYVKFSTEAPYLRIMFLNAVNTNSSVSFTSTNFTNWQKYLSGDTSLTTTQKNTFFNEIIGEGTSTYKSKRISVTTSNPEKDLYVAFFADYDAPYSYEDNGQTINTTYGEALKNNIIDSSVLTVQVNVEVSNADIVS